MTDTIVNSSNPSDSNVEKLVKEFESILQFNEQMRHESWDDIDIGDEELDVIYYIESSYEYADSVGAQAATKDELEAHGIVLDHIDIEDNQND